MAAAGLGLGLMFLGAFILMDSWAKKFIEAYDRRTERMGK